MSDERMLSAMAVALLGVLCVLIMFRIYRVLVQMRAEGFRFWPRDAWGAAARVSLAALAIGLFFLPDHIKFMVALYPVRYWSLASVALLAIIFGVGSMAERRAAGAASVLVTGGLLVYSTVAAYPRFGPVVMCFGVLCLALATVAVGRRLSRHEHAGHATRQPRN